MLEDSISNPKVYSVSEINHLIRKDLEGSFPNIWLEGEVSNFFFHNNKHMYFDLKDENSKVKIVMFHQNNRKLSFDIEEGLHILINGYISVYEKRGEYQLIAADAQPVGRGALILAFEQLKEKLSREGIFDSSHKKNIPALPAVIGLATSAGGAVLKDIISVLRRRFPNFHLIVRNTNVGGPTSAADLCGAMDDLCEFGVDVIILARGGGSLEDLWGFNSEELARNIYNCEIPVISAVGHQTDFTISDFVADLRSATPSVAAENVILDKNKTIADIKNIIGVLQGKLSSRIRASKKQLLLLIDRKYFKEPGMLLNAGYQDSGILYKEMVDNVYERVRSKKIMLIRRASAVDGTRISAKIRSYRLNIRNNDIRWRSSILNYMQDRKKHLCFIIEGLEKNNPVNIIKRGFAIIYDPESGKNINSIKQVQIGKIIDILLKDGTIKAKAAKIIFKKLESGKKSGDR
ncbi:MAG TPA: exodeoxyribonuclease VII large subunit [Actinobacteria bacterium]|nr:exodeoxyribonuclease VII large subunit [Actinomycetota bacterium]